MKRMYIVFSIVLAFSNTVWAKESNKRNVLVCLMSMQKIDAQGTANTYLLWLVLAEGAISGVSTYKLLFLGRCKLRRTVWEKV